MAGPENNAVTEPGNGGRNAMQDELHALLQRCISGDQKAQKTLYDKYVPMVYGIIKRYVKQDEPAEEILNDAFYACFSRMHQFAFTGPFEAWLYRITVNAVAYHYKRNTKHKDVVYKDCPDEQVAASGNALQHLSFKELLGIIHRLPETQRVVFNLFVFEQYTHRDIAGLLDISEGSSRWYLNDARKRLKEMIATLTME